MRVTVTAIFEKEASDYASASKSFTSDRHDFHEGGLTAKQRKMYEGKLGEKAIKQFFIENKVLFEEDKTPFDKEDSFDFVIYNKVTKKKIKVDIKTRTRDFHTRTLEMVEQINKNPKDVYISIRLYTGNPIQAEIIGYAYKEDFLRINRIENLGYLDNYVLLDSELRNIDQLINEVQKNE